MIVRWLEMPWLMAKGFCMGMADLVPGVSGGTMAFILGIYERLLAAIRSFDAVWIKACLKFDLPTAFKRPHFNFIFPLLVGLFLAVWFFTHIISLPTLLHEYPEHVYGLFFGLIIASIYVLMQELQGFNAIDAITLALGTVFGLIIVNLVPVETPNATWFIFLSGAIAICAMILPGVSGSFLLLLLKKYSVIITAIGDFNLGVIVPFLLGCIVGLASFSRFLTWLLSRFYQRTLLVIKGILIASLWLLWPFQERLYETFAGKQKLLSTTAYLPEVIDNKVLEVAGLILVGACLVVAIHWLSLRYKTVKP